MEAKHTPGPWDTADIDQSDFYRYVVGENKIVCRVMLNNVIGNKRKHAEADARLIAAAPDLLSDLRAAACYIDALGGDSSTYRKTIAKAEGK